MDRLDLILFLKVSIDIITNFDGYIFSEKKIWIRATTTGTKHAFTHN
jgi:hypothetical protein